MATATETLKKVDVDEEEEVVVQPPSSDTEMAAEKEEEEEEEEKENTKPKIEEKSKRSRKKKSEEVEEEEKSVTPPISKKRRRGGEGGSDEAAVTTTTPTMDRPARERKTVERYSEPTSLDRNATPKLSIEKGPGTQLKDIPNVAFKLSKRKPDDSLQMLHSILFGKKAKVHLLKRNINQFSGFVWVENEEKQRGKLKEKLDKLFKEKLMDFCDILDIPITRTRTKKEELVDKLVEFLESPHATTEVSLAEKKQLEEAKKKKKRSVASAETQTKKRKQSTEVKKKKESSSKAEEKDEDVDEAESAESGGESDEDSEQKEVSDQGDRESEEEEKEKEQESKGGSGKKKMKGGSEVKPEVEKGTPAKSGKRQAKSSESKKTPASKKTSKVDDNPSESPKTKNTTSKKKKEDEKKSQKNQDAKNETSNKKSSKSVGKSSGKEQGKAKASAKPKAEPSREEMHAAVSNILKEVDFNTATLSDILRQLDGKMGVVFVVGLYGIRAVHMWNAVGYPLSLTSLLYIGSFVAILQSPKKSRKEDIVNGDLFWCLKNCFSGFLERMTSIISNVLAWRNYVVAPLKEEVVFRACIIPLLLCGGFKPYTIIFFSPIFFSLGTHFGIDLMHKKAEVKSIIEDVINNMTDEEEEEEEEAEDENAVKEGSEDEAV